LLKVAVEGEGVAELLLAHYHEAGAVGKGEILVVVLLKDSPILLEIWGAFQG